jgi:hypothetical protein
MSLAAYDVYKALPAIAPEPATDALEPTLTPPVPVEEPLSENPELEMVHSMSERRPTIPGADISEDEPGHVVRAPTALLSYGPESFPPPFSSSTNSICSSA